MKKKLLLVILVMAVLITASCSLTGGGGKETYKTIKSSVSDLTVEVPASWIETKVNADASVEVTDAKKGYSFVIIEEPADDFVDGFTVDDYTALVQGIVMQYMGVNEAPPLNDVVICDGINAKQYEISGSVEAVKVRSYAVVTKVNGFFYQFLGSSLEKSYDDAKTIFKTIIDSTDFGAAVIIDEPVAQSAKSDEGEAAAPAVQVIKSKKSSLTLEFPADWTEGFELDNVTIEMDNLANDSYALVVEENASDFKDGFTLDDYTGIIVEIMMENLGSTETPEITDIVVGDGVQAKQFIVSGEDGNFKLTYLDTCVKANDIFYNIQMYTISSKFEKAKPVFDEIIKSAAF